MESRFGNPYKRKTKRIKIDLITRWNFGPGKTLETKFLISILRFFNVIC